MKLLKSFSVISLLIALTVASGSALAKSVDINFLTWDGYLTDELKQKYIELMKKEHGLDVNLNILLATSQDDAGPALRSGKADIVTPPQNIPKDGRHKIIKDRLALALDVSRIPNHKNIVPELQNPAYMTKKGKLYGIPHIRGQFGLMYNTAFFPKEPESWNVLWDAKYKNKISIPGDVYDALIYSTALSEAVGRDDIFSVEHLDKPEIREKLKTLAENSENFWSGVATAGDVKGLALAPSWGFAIPELKAHGEEWKMATLKEGVTGYVDNFIVAAQVAEDPDKLTAVYALLNFTLSDEFQAHIVRDLASIPVTTTVNKLLTETEIAQHHLDDPEHFKNNIILWKPIPKRASNAMKAMWRAASLSVIDEKLAKAESRRNALK